MPWIPDPDFNLTLQRIISRARDEAIRGFRNEWSDIAERMSARGMGRSGALLGAVEAKAAELVMALGARLVAELLGTLQSVYGSLTADMVEWVRQTVTPQITNTASSIGKELDDARKQNAVREGAEEALRVAASRALRDMEITIGPLETRARLVHPAPVPSPTGTSIEYDVFICHASEDKPAVALPLAQALQTRGFRVWLDTFEIRIGDRILTRIDDGLTRSRFGVVIISPSFFGKEWTQMELNALAALEATAGRMKILPVWHNMTRAEVEEKSPLIAAVRAANTTDGIDTIADEIATVLRR